MATRRQPEELDRSPVIIVGAGPAGLAVGACLARAGVPAVILEQADVIGASWHGHYDRLHLHTDKSHSELPFFRFPGHYPRYVSRIQLIEYLESYAREFHLDVRLRQRAISAERRDGSWEITTPEGSLRSTNLVVATGYNREPFLPEWPGQSSFKGAVLHSSRYSNGKPFRNQKVLVVGFGNSGGEIALDLFDHGADPSMAVRGPVNVIPRELFGIPILTIAVVTSKLPSRLSDALNAPLLRAAVGDLTPFGLRPLRHGPVTQVRRDARIPLIDVGTIELIRQGKITIRPAIERFTNDGVVFVDGTLEAFDSVILATGYRPRVDSLLTDAAGAYDSDGTPVSSGRETAVPGLYFCGFFVSPTGMLREIAREARRIASDIIRRQSRPFTSD